MTNKEDEIVLRHPMIHDLQEIAKINSLVIKHANFETGDIIVTVDGNATTFEGVMQSLRFIDMVDRMALQAVDFDTGEITVRWFPQGVTKVYANLGVSKIEIDLIKQGKKINAIKEVRQRTGMGLADAKNVVEAAAEELRRRGLIQR